MVAVSDDGESAACLPLAVVDVVMRTYAQSQAWYARAGVIPGRSSTRSKAPGRFYDVGAGPLYAASGDGAILTCVDGHDYIDMLCALGAISLGYRSIPSRVVGGVYSLPLAVEAEAAEMVLQHVAPRASQVRFTKTGSEACHAAYRIAKAATGRDIVLVGDWAYHGWYEWCATPKGAGVVTYPHGFDLNDVLHQDQTAAVFIEPHRWESVNIEWLKSVRAFCDRIGALLVFDSMIYGGRWALGGASAYFGVQPDLECFGKALGNGEAVACVVGGEILEQHGQVASGTFRPGEEVAVLPSGRRTRVTRLLAGGHDVGEAFEGQSVVISLEQELDVSRGDMIVRVHNVPQVASRFEATLCWMDEERPLRPGVPYLLQHTTRRVKALVSAISYRIDVNTLHRVEAAELGLNEIGRVSVETAQPVFFDPYTINRSTGGFILIDPVSNRTVSAGMIRYAAGNLPEGEEPLVSSNVTLTASAVSIRERSARAAHEPCVLWLTGLSGSGKSTVARLLERALFDRGALVTHLDGDNVRHGLCGDLGFSDRDRSENIRRVAEVARLFHDAGHLVLCTFISPFRADRERARVLVPAGRFVEVYVRCDLAECKRRDPKGLYRKAEAGEIPEFTGVSSPYEEPVSPELVVDTGHLSAEQAADLVLTRLESLGIIRPPG